MNITIKSGSRHGEVNAPKSKSLLHRFLICSALSGNPNPESLIAGDEVSSDIGATINCLKTIVRAIGSENLQNSYKENSWENVCRNDSENSWENVCRNDSGNSYGIDRRNDSGNSCETDRRNDSGNSCETDCGNNSGNSCETDCGNNSGNSCETDRGNSYDKSPVLLDPKESGSTLRFLIPIISALGLSAVFTPEKSLAARPIKTLTDLLEAHGAKVEYSSGYNCEKIACSGRIVPGFYTLSGNISSQYVSGLLMALPLLDGDSVLRVDGPVESLPYISMTEEVIKSYGIKTDKKILTSDNEKICGFIDGQDILRKEPGQKQELDSKQKFTPAQEFNERHEFNPTQVFNSTQEFNSAQGFNPTQEFNSQRSDILRSENSCLIYHIPGNQIYKEPEKITIEGDWSNSAPFLCMGALSEKGITVHGLSLLSKQGDKAVIDILKYIGAEVNAKNNSITVSKGRLKSQRIDAGDIPDIVPVLAPLLAVCRGQSAIVNAARLRFKESDRLKTTETMLKGLGADIIMSENGLTLIGKAELEGGNAYAHNDHRIAMAAAAAASVCKNDVVIDGFECVSKSYPGFFKALNNLEVEK